MDSHLDPDLALGSNVALHVSKKKRKQGSVSDQLAQLHLPPGPSSLAELLEYPKQHVQTIAREPELLQRVCTLLQRGIVHSSDYSGMLAEREGLRLLAQGLHDEVGVSVPYQFCRACDIDKECQALLVHSSRHQDDGCSCVFQDIREQIHPHAQAWCQACVPSENRSKECFAAAFESMDAFLAANGDWAVDQDGFWGNFYV